MFLWYICQHTDSAYGTNHTKNATLWLAVETVENVENFEHLRDSNPGLSFDPLSHLFCHHVDWRLKECIENAVVKLSCVKSEPFFISHGLVGMVKLELCFLYETATLLSYSCGTS